jgi:hypothetical protein
MTSYTDIGARTMGQCASMVIESNGHIPKPVSSLDSCYIRRRHGYFLQVAKVNDHSAILSTESIGNVAMLQNSIIPKNHHKFMSEHTPPLRATTEYLYDDPTLTTFATS